MKFYLVIDFKNFAKKYCTNIKTTVTGQRVNWLNAKWIQVTNYRFEIDQFQEIDVVKMLTRYKARQVAWQQIDSDLKMCYNSKQQVSVQKKADLVQLCTKEIIPEEFHQIY